MGFIAVFLGWTWLSGKLWSYTWVLHKIESINIPSLRVRRGSQNSEDSHQLCQSSVKSIQLLEERRIFTGVLPVISWVFPIKVRLLEAAVAKTHDTPISKHFLGSCKEAFHQCSCKVPHETLWHVNLIGLNLSLGLPHSLSLGEYRLLKKSNATGGFCQTCLKVGPWLFWRSPSPWKGRSITLLSTGRYCCQTFCYLFSPVYSSIKFPFKIW